MASNLIRRPPFLGSIQFVPRPGFLLKSPECGVEILPISVVSCLAPVGDILLRTDKDLIDAQYAIRC